MSLLLKCDDFVRAHHGQDATASDLETFVRKVVGTITVEMFDANGDILGIFSPSNIDDPISIWELPTPMQVAELRMTRGVTP